MKTAWILVNKTDGKPQACRHDFGKTVTLFSSRKGAKIFKDEHQRVQRVCLIFTGNP